MRFSWVPLTRLGLSGTEIYQIFNRTKYLTYIFVIFQDTRFDDLDSYFDVVTARKNVRPLSQYRAELAHEEKLKKLTALDIQEPEVNDIICVIKRFLIPCLVY